MVLLLLVTILFSAIHIFNISVSSHRLYKDVTLSKHTTNAMKAILSMLIVLHHLSYYVDNWFLCQFNYWGNLICGIFFFLSGYGLMKSYKRKGPDYLKGFLGQHFKRLYTPLLIVTIVFQLTLFSYGEFSWAKIGEGIKVGLPPSPNSWYVYALFLLYLFWWLLFSYCASRKWTYCFFLIVLLLYTIILKKIGYEGFWYSSIYAFLIGLLIADGEEKYKYEWCRYKKIISLILIGCIICVVSYSMYSVYYSHTLYAPLLCTIYPIFVYITVRGCNINNKLLGLIGSISYELYIVHGIVLSIILRYTNDDVYLVVSTVTISLICSVVLKGIDDVLLKKIIHINKKSL